MISVSQKAINFIIAEEVTSEAWYNAKAIHPVVPDANSGVTLGIGYDCSAQTDAVILKDWLGVIGQSAASRLAKCAGLHGSAAAHMIPGLRDIALPYISAVLVFQASTLPRYAAQIYAALPNCDILNGDQFGALVSIGYNRGNGGWTMTDDRHGEMAQIHAAMVSRFTHEIPTLILQMCRLWPQDSGLWKRRVAESKLFEGTFP